MTWFYPSTHTLILVTAPSLRLLAPPCSSEHALLTSSFHIPKEIAMIAGMQAPEHIL